MKRHRQILNNTIRSVTANRMTREQAARVLGVSVRTIHNYVKNFLAQGPDGLRDHRRGHFRKIDLELESRILAYKLDRPDCSARWVRDRLKLSVSVEAVRQILLKHHLNRSNLGPARGSSMTPREWDPF